MIFVLFLTGPSGGMEIEAAEILWSRSTQLGLRYTSMVADGDSKAFDE